MTRTLVRGLIAALISLAIFLVVFGLAYLVLLLIVGTLAISYFNSVDPNWDAGPGGIIFLAVFLIIVPFSILLTALAWKLICRRLSKKYELFNQGNNVANIVFVSLEIGIFGVSVYFLKALLFSEHLYGKYYVG